MNNYSRFKDQKAIITAGLAIARRLRAEGATLAVNQTPLVDAMPPEQVKANTDKIPMKRCGTLDEAAAMAAFIVSPESSFTTGFTFDLTSGRAVY
ncbi:MAG: SDR family oxidoreductase [Lacunisphaera sp.]|nr:SDR family oxidoreductase [Lacunisphaera sp.]